MNSSLIDEPSLLKDNCLKRLRDEEREEELSSSKGVKLSESAGDSAEFPEVDL